MAKLTGAKKKAFLERMAKGRRKAARGNPARKKTAAKKKAPKKPKAKAAKSPKPRKMRRRNPKLTGAKKKAFLERMAKGRKKAARGNPKIARNKPAKKKAPIKGKRRRNPDTEEAASRMFETFHQKAPGRIVEYEELVQFPGNFAELGKLIELRVFLDTANPDFPFTRFGDAQVVCTPDGNNIYFVDGDQSISLESLEITTDKDTVELGPCTYICYLTVKGFHDFEPTKYWHRFGEEDGIFPRLGYDRLNKRLFLIGGNYQVKRPGIVN
jgi:hypothetical protein